MIREYLRLHSDGNDIDDDDEEEGQPFAQTKRKDIEELDTLASRLNISENEEQVYC